MLVFVSRTSRRRRQVDILQRILQHALTQRILLQLPLASIHFCDCSISMKPFLQNSNPLFRRESCCFPLEVLNSVLQIASKVSIPHLPQRTTFGRCRMQERANLLVFGPMRALTILGTITADALALATSPADQEPRLGESSTLATVVADPAPHAWPDLSQMRPVRHGTHNPCWSPHAFTAQRCVGGVYKFI